MFAGHFGLAAAIKAKRPEVPLWALMPGTQLLDVIFVPLFVMGVETMEPAGGSGYGEMIIHADYSHSLAGALVIAAAAGLLAWKAWSRGSGMVIAATVFSHWLLDLLVHRVDLPVLPGNAGGLPLLGLSLWQWPAVSIGLEAALIVLGVLLYARSVHSRTKLPDTRAGGRSRKRAVLSGSVLSGLLILSLVTDIIGIG